MPSQGLVTHRADARAIAAARGGGAENADAPRGVVRGASVRSGGSPEWGALRVAPARRMAGLPPPAPG
ncbi:hypothetical protein FHR33_002569 [Nonomuraea dietziae]|uniref:Uncharacterized protein n=1 Tax=Nonomuraea dietziae TaxID=65515 RepID=A0A7W5V765_9ACTN|nr:hypothetical protein [Nonomuraea dietziae]